MHAYFACFTTYAACFVEGSHCNCVIGFVLRDRMDACSMLLPCTNCYVFARTVGASDNLGQGFGVSVDVFWHALLWSFFGRRKSRDYVSFVLSVLAEGCSRMD